MHLTLITSHGLSPCNCSEWQSRGENCKWQAPRNKSLSLEALLLRLLDAEQADRQARSLRYQLKAARFPIHRDLTGFDWSETPLDAARIQELAKGHYLETAHNLILVGGTGTGKTHLAIALGVAAIHHGKRIRFYNAVDLVNLLEREKAQGKAGNLAKQLTQIDAVILPSQACKHALPGNG